VEIQMPTQVAQFHHCDNARAQPKRCRRVAIRIMFRIHASLKIQVQLGTVNPT